MGICMTHEVIEQPIIQDKISNKSPTIQYKPHYNRNNLELMTAAEIYIEDSNNILEIYI
jgi:hypothetical protein